jgi:glucokinase
VHPEPVVLGMDFGGTKIACAVADLEGRPKARAVIATEADRGAEQAVARALGSADELLAGQPAKLVGVGVSTMGITYDDRVELAPNVVGWSDLRLPELLRTHYPGTPVRLDNDVKAAAFAELTWGALRDVDPGVYVNLGSGIAVAITSGGQVLRGAHGASGEVGYWRRQPIGSTHRSDGRAPFEEFAGGAGVRERARHAFGFRAGFADLSNHHEAPVKSMLDEIVAEICWHVTNIAILVDAEKIVLGGGYLRTPEPLMTRLTGSLRSYVPYPPQVEIGRFEDSAGLTGAVALACAAAESGLAYG